MEERYASIATTSEGAMRISILSTEQGVWVRLGNDYPLKTQENLDFYRAGASSIETALLRKHLQDQLDAMMEEVRQVSYLRGWRDAKSKRKKQAWFSDFAQVMDWEKKEAGLT